MLDNLYQTSYEASIEEMAKSVNVPLCVAESFAVLMCDKKQAVLLAVLANDIRNGRVAKPGFDIIECHEIKSVADLKIVTNNLTIPRKKRELTPEMRVARYNAKLEKLKKHYGIED